MATNEGTAAADITVLCCPDCLRPLSTTTHRVPYCMNCGKTPSGPIPGRPATAETPPFIIDDRRQPPTTPEREAKMVLCCAECERPLSLTPGGGSHCVPCGYSPSMQDTFFKGMCPRCDVETTKTAGGPRSCPRCGESFTN